MEFLNPTELCVIAVMPPWLPSVNPFTGFFFFRNSWWNNRAISLAPFRHHQMKTCTTWNLGTTFGSWIEPTMRQNLKMMLNLLKFELDPRPKNPIHLIYFLFFLDTVSPRIGRTSVPKKSRPIWNHTIGVYTITCAKNRTISRKSH